MSRSGGFSCLIVTGTSSRLPHHGYFLPLNRAGGAVDDVAVTQVIGHADTPGGLEGTERDHLILARQPIFDSKRRVWGYELLFRDGSGKSFDGDAMTAELLLRVGMDVGLEQLVGKKKASINVTRPYLTGEREVPLPADQTVLEILETVDRDPELVDGCRRMSTNGYLLSLDNYVYRPGDEPLLELVNVIKIDVLRAGADDLVHQVERCCRFGAYLVAQKVETQEHFLAAQEAGFHMFQGYLLSKPISVEGLTLSPNRAATLCLIQKLWDPDVSPGDVERIIEADPGLALRFLRAAGAGAASGLRRQIGSVREAAVLFGNRRLRSWASLIALGDIGSTVPEQMAIAMARARTCELIADELRPGLGDTAYTAGLISAMDLLLGASKEEVVASLSITDELKDAVLGLTGRMGHILHDALLVESGGDLTELRCGVAISRLGDISIQAMKWATELCALVEAADEEL